MITNVIGENMTLDDIETGKSYACKFKVSTFIDDEGNAVSAKLAVGQKHPGMPGTYESLGLIQIRDTEKELVQLKDTKDGATYYVPWVDCWDVDTVEWIDRETVA